MIPQLRRKFILINMSLVSLVLIIVFIAIGFSSYERTKSESMMAMDKLLDRKSSDEPWFMEIGGDKKPDGHGPLIPAFSVILDDKMNVKEISRENVSVDDAIVRNLVTLVQSTGTQSGTLWQDKLRYLVRNTPEGTKVAFADMNREVEVLTDLLWDLLLVGTGALGAFGAISIYLSHWALKPVEHAWDQQKRFVADASHELRTPLTVILANTGILLSHREDRISDQVKWIEHTEAEALRMKKLVEDLLFLAKSDADHKPILKEPVNLSDALWNAVLPFESIAYENGVTIDAEIQPGVTVQGDEGQLKQLAVILVDNACKYAGSGGRVSVKLTQQKGCAHLVVNNTGSLIPPEDLPHLFDRFYRVDSARTREQGGYGLGLAIARSIVESHGGTLSAHSTEMEGTTFRVRL